MANYFNDHLDDILKSYEYSISNGIIDPKIYEFEDKKSKRNYDQIINMIEYVNPKEFKTTDFNSITKEEMFEIFCIVVEKVFGDYGVSKIKSFIESFQYQDTNEIFNGVTSKIYDSIKKEFVGVIVAMPKAKVTAIVVTMFHEFTHYLFHEFDYNFNGKKYYVEILPIFSEKVISSFIEDALKEKNFTKKIESTRLECINWHHNINPKLVDSFINLYTKNNYLKNNIFNENSLHGWIKSPKGIELKKSYDKNLKASYGIGYTYASMLYSRYIDDEKSVKDTLKRIYEKDITIQDALDKYNISLRNRVGCSEVTNNIKSIKF